MAHDDIIQQGSFAIPLNNDATPGKMLTAYLREFSQAERLLGNLVIEVHFEIKRSPKKPKADQTSTK